MRKSLLCAIALLAGGAAVAADAPKMTAKEQAGFEKAIAGLTPGEPVSCVSQRQLRGNKSYGEGVIVFEGNTRSTLYVNRPVGGCPKITSARALRTRTTSDQLCRGDIVTVFEPSSGIEYGGCGLGDFVPYKR